MPRTKLLFVYLALTLVLCLLAFFSLKGTPPAAVAAATNAASNAEAVQPPLTNCCLRRIDKVMRGQRRADFGTPYNCDTGSTFKGVTKVELTLSTTTPTCDQDVTIPNNSRLEAQCTTIRRVDLFGHSLCDFKIKHPTSGATHFSGTLVLIDRASHPPPTGCRACNAQGFLEGWLDGKGEGQFTAFKLQAVIAARATMPTSSQPTNFLGDLNGTLLKCP